jgi:hypothetical protein
VNRAPELGLELHFHPGLAEFQPNEKMIDAKKYIEENFFSSQEDKDIEDEDIEDEDIEEEDKEDKKREKDQREEDKEDKKMDKEQREEDEKFLIYPVNNSCFGLSEYISGYKYVVRGSGESKLQGRDSPLFKNYS